MFCFRDTREGDVRVDVAFTDASLDLRSGGRGLSAALDAVRSEVGVPLALIHQVHGAAVHVVDAATGAGKGATADEGSNRAPVADAQVTDQRGVALVVRVADCVPVVLADPGAGVIGVAHAGRRGVVLDVVTRTVDAMRGLGAVEMEAWVGPHVCGACYEVPDTMQQEAASAVPATRSTTRAGTPGLDLGAGVRAQLEGAGVVVSEVGTCTLEDPGLHSHRRDGEASGRLAGLVWIS